MKPQKYCIRPLQENGKWQHKTEKEYLCVRDGAEWGFTSAEYKIAQAEGWEKQYQYLVGERKVYMAPSEAEKQGYERANKYPKVQSMADRIQFLSVGTAMNSYSSGGKNGQPLPIGIWHSIRR